MQREGIDFIITLNYHLVSSVSI